MLVPFKECGNGANLDLPPSELTPGVWSAGQNATFANGIFEKRKGFEQKFTTPAVTPYMLGLYPVGTTRYAVQAGIAKVYVDDGTTQTEITRYTDGKTISSITHVTTTATLTTSTAHGRSNGDTVTVFGATPAAYNGTFVITVTGATTFTYTMLSDPGGSATTVGQYSYNATSNFTGAIDDRWCVFVFNGVLIMNNPVDGPYYWNGDTSTRLRRLPGWPVGQVAYAMRAFKDFLIAMRPTISGTVQPHTVMWSTSTEPGTISETWVAADTNDAGDSPQTAETGGQLVDGCAIGGSFFLFKEDSRFVMDYVGGNDVFRIDRVGADNEGLLARSCVVSTPKGQVWLSNGDVRLHAGAESTSLAEGRVRQWLNAMMDSTNAARSFLCVEPERNEVWVCFPSGGASSCDKALAWNWNDDKWSLPFTLPNLTFAVAGLTPSLPYTWATIPAATWDAWVGAWDQNPYASNVARLVVATTAPKLGFANTGSTDFGTSISWYAEMRGQSLGDTDVLKLVSRMRPHLKAVAGTQVQVKLTTTMHPDDDPVYSGSATFTQGTSTWANKFTKAGRYACIWIGGLDDQAVEMRSFDLELGDMRARF